MWKDGVFPKDPDLKQFLISGPAILAALQIQNAFEMKNCKEDCEQLIEDYAYWGGDRGLTEQTMREACGMPPRDVRNVITQAAAVIVVDNEEPQEAEEGDAVWRKISESLMQHLLIMKRLDLTARMMTALKLKDAPNMNKEELIKDMQANKRLIQSHSRGKSDTVFALGLRAEVALESVIEHTNRQGCPDLPETLAISALQQYLEREGRADNAQLVASVYKKIAAKLGGTGRPRATVKARKEKYAEQSQKMLNHEDTCLSLLKQLTGPHMVLSQDTPARKRLRTKGPDVKQEEREVKDETPAGSGVKLETMQCSYEYPSTTLLRTRKIVKGLGSQKFTRRAQLHLLSHTHDLDMQNSVFTVLTQLLDKLKPIPSLPRDLRATLERCVSSRDEICREELKMSREEGKQVLTAVLYGGAIPEHLARNDFLICLSKISLYLRWLAMSLLQDEFDRFRTPEVGKKNPDRSILAHLYLAAEDYILSTWVEYLQSFKPTHLSLHFDGVRIALTAETSIADLCYACQEHIQKKTGFQVKIREKQHCTVLQHIKKVSEQEPSLTTGNELLEQDGNCIPAAIANMLGKRSETQEALALVQAVRDIVQCEACSLLTLRGYQAWQLFATFGKQRKATLRRTLHQAR